jgi:hypothetical protein
MNGEPITKERKAAIEREIAVDKDYFLKLEDSVKKASNKLHECFTDNVFADIDNLFDILDSLETYAEVMPNTATVKEHIDILSLLTIVEKMLTEYESVLSSQLEMSYPSLFDRGQC